MSTENTTVVSNDAVELLTCFYDGLDKVVYSLAEKISKSRAPVDGRFVIEFDDVKEAGERVMDAVKALVDDGKLQKIIADSIQTCFDNKTCSNTVRHGICCGKIAR